MGSPRLSWELFAACAPRPLPWPTRLALKNILRALPASQVGDWGRNGEYNQSRVAAAMALRAEALQPDFVLTVGDNFYEAGV